MTNKLVYEVLPANILDESKKKNLVVGKNSYRRYRFHQFLTEDTGLPHLDKHLVSVITLMRACDTWEEFENKLNKVFKNEELN